MQINGTRSICAVILYVLALGRQALALELVATSQDSIKNAASTATYGMMTYYTGNETGGIPGAFPSKWWEGSALLLALLNYWHFTGDDYYNEELSIALQWQSGTNGDYMPSNYSSFLGNDDQMFWGLSAMTAVEYKLPDRPTGFSWLSLAQGVFNTQKARWDTTMCGGGLRWQIYVYEGSGYYMKNAVSNGGFFQLAARLYRYTGNEEYYTWAKKTWEWSCSVPLVDNSTWTVDDSTNGEQQCANGDQVRWTYNYGVYFGGCAYLYAATNDEYWLNCTTGLLNSLWSTFFTEKNNYIISDWECETREICNNNEVLFKGLVASWLAQTALLIPSLYDEILSKLQASGQGAANSCTGNSNSTCGVRWTTGTWDGLQGMEQQISASNAFSVQMLPWINGTEYGPPVTSKTGGNSSSNVNAGENEDAGSGQTTKPVTTGDKAGAGILTIIFVGGLVGMATFMFLGA
ncbi:mannan endo-1-6-alpha-mannosidase [Penicillium frequentans]|uniref:Mannan endo-1,6-alpha-mannosidase n=1 Tax=Penicillium frequentans TaxID=3151616 RepID=A0AAD6GE36_9EURO|nr:mannan endo-1-6-alpha-mannosidase [Penicillium glabrum]KAJ5563890.1 mannan endo-1-6-alpha-mannosidase [Penicillium glabrum]